MLDSTSAPLDDADSKTVPPVAASAPVVAPVPPPGWYPTAEGSHERYWDGESWSEARDRVVPVLAPSVVETVEPSARVAVVPQPEDPFVPTPPIARQTPAVEDPIDAFVWSLVATDAPHDPYADLPAYAAVPPIGRDSGRGGLGDSADDKIRRALADADQASSRLSATSRPSWAAWVLGFFGMWTTWVLLAVEVASVRFDLGHLISRPTVVGFALAYPIGLVLALIDSTRARALGVRMSLLWSVVPPLQVAVRAWRSRSALLAAQIVLSALMLFVWFAPMVWLEAALAALTPGS